MPDSIAWTNMRSRKEESISSLPTAPSERTPRVVPGGLPSSAIYQSFIACEAALKRFLGRLIYRKEDIEDLAQETFLRAFHAVDARELENPRAYLFRVARNIALKELSRKSRQLTDYLEDSDADPVEEGSGVEEGLLAQQKIELYCKAIATLPLQCRRVFLMRKVHGMSHKEIASSLGISHSAVEKQVALGVEKFAAWMDKNDG